MDILLGGIIDLSQVLGNVLVRSLKRYLKLEIADKNSDMAGIIGFVALLLILVVFLYISFLLKH